MKDIPSWIFQTLRGWVRVQATELKWFLISYECAFSKFIPHSLQLDCLPKKDFCCVCDTEDCPFLRSFSVNASVLLTGDEFIIYITFRNTGELPIRSRGRESREMFSFLQSPP